MAVGRDSPAWTFGLNPKAPSPRVPGVGEYDVAGRMVRDGVGTHFSRIGAKPMRPRGDVKRLVFGTGTADVRPFEATAYSDRRGGTSDWVLVACCWHCPRCVSAPLSASDAIVGRGNAPDP